MIFSLIGLLVCAAFEGGMFFISTAFSCVPAIALLIVILVDKLKRF